MYKRRRQILGCHRLATPTELRRAGKTRTDARLKKHGCRRYATWAGQVVSTLERHTVVVAGADAAGTALPPLARQLIVPRAEEAGVTRPGRNPGG